VRALQNGGVALGALLTLVGVILPARMLVELTRGSATPSLPGALLEHILLGAQLFKFGLIGIGVVVIGMARSSVWSMERSDPRRTTSECQGSSVGLIALILLIALALRLYGLEYGLWFDEIAAYVNYVRMPVGELITTYDSENQQFLYTLLAHACVAILGDGAWVVRLPAVIFGVGSIWAVYLLGRQLASEREAILAAALLAVSYHHIWFSQNARGYTALLFWTVFSSWLLLRALQTCRPAWWVLYAGAVSLGVYTHVTMLFVVFAQFVVYAMTLYARRRETWPHKWAGLFLGFCFAGLLSFELYAFVLPQLVGTIGQTTKVSAWNNPLWTIVELLRGMQVGVAGSIFAIVVILGLFGAGMWDLARANSSILPLLMIPALLGIVVVTAMGHPLWPRFFFFLVGFATIILVRGLMVLGGVLSTLLSLNRRRMVTAGTALCLSVIVISAASVGSAYAPKQDYRGARVFVEENRAPGDAVVTVGLATFPFKSFYKTGWDDAKSLTDLDTIRAHARATWVLYTMPLHLRSYYPEIMASIESDFEPVKQFYGTLGGGTVFVCRAAGPSAVVATAQLKVPISEPQAGISSRLQHK